MRPLARMAAIASFATLVGTSTPASADALSGGEVEKLIHGQTISRKQDFRQGTHRYVGGVAYTVLDCTPDEVAQVTYDLGIWKRLIPRVRDVRTIALKDNDPRVEVVHGNALVSVKYSMRVRRDGRMVRFWMDPSMPHDIQDVWGFFRPEALPDGRTLVTFGILIDLGDGMLRDLFESRVQELALEIPDNVRTVVVERAARGWRAAR
jgi:hypothetical protein